MELFKLNLVKGLKKDLATAQNDITNLVKNEYPELLESSTKDIENWMDKMLKEVEGDITNHW